MSFLFPSAAWLCANTVKSHVWWTQHAGNTATRQTSRTVKGSTYGLDPDCTQPSSCSEVGTQRCLHYTLQLPWQQQPCCIPVIISTFFFFFYLYRGSGCVHCERFGVNTVKCELWSVDERLLHTGISPCMIFTLTRWVSICSVQSEEKKDERQMDHMRDGRLFAQERTKMINNVLIQTEINVSVMQQTFIWALIIEQRMLPLGNQRNILKTCCNMGQDYYGFLGLCSLKCEYNAQTLKVAFNIIILN